MHSAARTARHAHLARAGERFAFVAKSHDFSVLHCGSAIKLRPFRLLAALGIALALYGALAAFALPPVARHVLADWQADVPGLKVDLRDLSFNPWTLTVKARGLALSLAGRDVLRMERADLRLSASSLWQRAVHFDAVTIAGAALAVRRDAGGNLDISRLLPRPAVASGTRQPALPWQIDHLRLDALDLSVTDPAIGLIDPLHVLLPRLDLDRIGTLQAGSDAVDVSLHALYDGKPVWDLRWQGNLDIARQSSTGRIALERVSLPWLDRSLAHRLPLLVDAGEADLRIAYALTADNGQPHLLIQDSALAVRGLKIRGKGAVAPQLTVPKMRVEVTSIDPAQRRLVGRWLNIESPELITHRSAEGELDLVRLFRQWPATRTQPTSTAPWSIVWPGAELRSASIRLDDASGLGTWQLPGIDVRIGALQNTGKVPLQVSAKGQGIASGTGIATGRWKLQGTIIPTRARLHLDWQLRDLDIRPLSAPLSQLADVQVLDGQLAAQGSLFADLHHTEALEAAGSLQIQRLDLQAKSWGRLRGRQLDAGRWRYSGGTLLVDDFAAQGVQAAGGGVSLGLDRLSATGVTVRGAGILVEVQQADESGLQWRSDGRAAGGTPAQGTVEQAHVEGLHWEGPGRKAALRRLLVSPFSLALGRAAQPVSMGWDRLELLDATVDLGAQRCTVDGLAASGAYWRGSQPWLQFAALKFTPLRVDLAERQLALGLVDVQGGQVRLALTKARTLRPLAELQALAPPAALSPPPTMAGSRVAASKGWRVALRGADIGLRSLAWQDEGDRIAPLIASDVVLHTGAWPRTDDSALPVRLAFLLDEGQWRWDGTVEPQEPSADGRISIEHADLRPLQPLLAKDTYATIGRGTVSTAGVLSVRAHADAAPAVHFQGKIQVEDAQLLDVRDQRQILAWNRVEAPQVLADRPGRLDLGRIVADGLLTRIAIAPDHRLNWQDLLRPVSAAEAAPQAAAQAPGQRTAPPQWPVRIEQIALKRCGIEFADVSLREAFVARIHDLEGHVGPFASDAPQDWTEVQFAGRVNNFGHVDMSGRIAPMAKPLQADASLHFSGIELPTLNPYAAQFAGYRVDQGMLDLQLRYKLDQGRIDGSNHARIDQLMLGPQVGNADVPALDLQLAIDVLRDDDGVIDIDVPVQGDLNDPDLILRDVVFQALAGALRDVLESPLHLLAGLIGANDETLRHIAFAPGAARLSAPEQAKLQDMAKALGKHQRLMLFIRPGYEPVADLSAAPSAKNGSPGALRALALQRAEAIKSALVASGIRSRRIFIDEPAELHDRGADGSVLLSLDLKMR